MVEVRNNGVPLIEQAPKAALTQAVIGVGERAVGRTESRPKRPIAPKPSGLGPLDVAMAGQTEARRRGQVIPSAALTAPAADSFPDLRLCRFLVEHRADQRRIGWGCAAS